MWTVEHRITLENCLFFRVDLRRGVIMDTLPEVLLWRKRECGMTHGKDLALYSKWIGAILMLNQ